MASGIISPLLLILLIQNQSTKRSAFIGYMWGLGLFATGISWVHVSIDTFGGMPKAASLFLMALLVGYLSIYSALFTGLVSKFKAQKSLVATALLIPALWMLSDYLRGWALTGFPWLLLGYSQIDGPLGHLALSVA
ncbi:apolipoprotein N-acyltransferase [Vibrio sp. JCM 19236]|nr:apolipoprotein N-acyltransferase [Vibrio sp. JCM 19236]